MVLNLKEAWGPDCSQPASSMDSYRVLAKGVPVKTKEDEVKEAKRRTEPFHPVSRPARHSTVRKPALGPGCRESKLPEPQDCRMQSCSW